MGTDVEASTSYFDTKHVPVADIPVFEFVYVVDSAIPAEQQNSPDFWNRQAVPNREVNEGMKSINRHENVLNSQACLKQAHGIEYS